jgi:hypothetical protein
MAVNDQTVIKNANGQIVRTITDYGGGTLSIKDGRGNFEGYIVKK